MNTAESASCAIIERALASSPAFRCIDERVYLVKQGTCFVMITVLPWGEDRAVVRCVAQLVKGVTLAPELARQLLELNAILRFGAFAFVADEGLILFAHSILGGASLDEDELLATVRDVAEVADEYDERIARHFGGQTMRELLDHEPVTRLMEIDPDGFEFKN